MAAALVQASIAYRTALAEADEMFDYHMQQMALSLRPGVPLSSGPGGALGGEPGEEIFDFMVQIWSPDGVQVFRSTARATLPQRAVLGFSNVEANGTTYRVFSMQTRSQVIQVAQDMAVRRNMAGTMALRTVGPIAVMAPLLMLVVWWVVSAFARPGGARAPPGGRAAGRRPVAGDRSRPARRSPPLVHELNLLFGRVRHAFEAQQNFVADAAHELRIAAGGAEAAGAGLERRRPARARRVAVARLTAGIDRAMRLVEQLLVLARQEAGLGRAATGQSRSNCAEVARRTVADAAAAAKARRIDLGLEQADAGRVSGQPDALRILLRNLLDNAIKYTPQGGRVDVAIRREGDRLVLAVEDSGPGIAARSASACSTASTAWPAARRRAAGWGWRSSRPSPTGTARRFGSRGPSGSAGCGWS